jgi:hypothetical protein
LKQDCDEPLSDFAFKIDLRRYTKGDGWYNPFDLTVKVRRCRLTLSNPVLKLESAYGFSV